MKPTRTQLAAQLRTLMLARLGAEAKELGSARDAAQAAQRALTDQILNTAIARFKRRRDVKQALARLDVAGVRYKVEAFCKDATPTLSNVAVWVRVDLPEVLAATTSIPVAHTAKPKLAERLASAAETLQRLNRQLMLCEMQLRRLEADTNGHGVAALMRQMLDSGDKQLAALLRDAEQRVAQKARDMLLVAAPPKVKKATRAKGD